MADEPKSKTSNLVGMITAVTGLIAALAALSGALKLNFTGQPGDTIAVAPENTAAPASASAPAKRPPLTATQKRSKSRGASSRSGATTSAPPAGGDMADAATGTDPDVVHDTPRQAVHVEAPPHHHEPEPATSQDSGPDGE